MNKQRVKVEYMRKMFLAVVALVTLLCAGVTTPPVGWGDFQMGLVNNGRVEWDEPMKDAILMGDQFKLDRRYIYIDDTLNVKSYWTGTKNWSQDSFYVAEEVKPAIVIYMLQRGGDSWSAIQEGMNDKSFMEAYFRYISLIADSTKGQQPLYVLEPDVWTYVLQNAREANNNLDNWDDIENNNLDAFCHINDLGFPWLEEFENKISNLPGAIIKTLKMRDPESYAGILIGFWGFQPSSTEGIGLFNNADSVIAKGAQETGKFVQALLESTPYKGDFCGLEKNGQDAGYWTGAYYDALFWNDRQNAAWVNFANTISDSAQLPMIGWQISIGHEGLPNTLNQYEDTFFPYLFNNTQDFIDAGLIGMLAGVAGQGKGTMPTPPNGKLYVHPDNFPGGTRGDDGWFYTEYAKFNSLRPLLPVDNTEYHSVIATVVGDTLTEIDTDLYPAWDPAKIYQPEWGSVMHISYEGNIYEVYQYSSAGAKPDESPYSFRNLGPVTIVGGTVWNDSIYYSAGENVVHYFHPKVTLDGYGIGSIKVNGIETTLDKNDRIAISNIDKDYRVEVKFVPNGQEVAIEFVRQSISIPKIRVDLSGITVPADATVSLYSLRGQELLRTNATSGNTVSLSGLTTGIYVAKIEGIGWSEQIKLNVR